MLLRATRPLVLIAFAVLLLTSCYKSGSTPAEIHMRTPAQIMRANCGTCHGVDGSGGVSWVDPTWFAPMLSGASAAVVKGMVRAGRAPVMPMFGVG